MNFTLHTEPSVSPPEFSITCRTEGGPATTVYWVIPNVEVQDGSGHESSQIIVDTSNIAVNENSLRVRGRESGTYNINVLLKTTVINSFRPSLLL